MVTQENCWKDFPKLENPQQSPFFLSLYSLCHASIACCSQKCHTTFTGSVLGVYSTFDKICICTCICGISFFGLRFWVQLTNGNQCLCKSCHSLCTAYTQNIPNECKLQWMLLCRTLKKDWGAIFLQYLIILYILRLLRLRLCVGKACMTEKGFVLPSLLLILFGRQHQRVNNYIEIVNLKSNGCWE